MDNTALTPAFHTRNELAWLLGEVQVTKGYEYRMRSNIKKKLQTFQRVELPLLAKVGFLNDLSDYLTANPQIDLRANPRPQANAPEAKG